MSIGVLLIILVVCAVVILYLRSFAQEQKPASQELITNELIKVGIYILSWIVGTLVLIWIWLLLQQMWGAPVTLITVAAFVIGFLVLSSVMGKWNKDLKIHAEEYGRKKEEERRRFWQPASRLEGRLQKLSDNLLPLFDHMPRIKVKVVDEPIQRTEPNIFLPSLQMPVEVASVGYCTGSGDLEGAYIGIKEELLRYADPSEVERILKHEMVHAWMSWKGIREDDPHGPMFKAKARQMGC